MKLGTYTDSISAGQTMSPDAAYFFSSLSELGMDAFGNFACKCGNIFSCF